MTQATSACVMVVKVDIDGDVRRLKVTTPSDALPLQILEAVRTAVAQGFDVEEASLPALKYQDEEGDLCTLVAATVSDMLEISAGKTLRLFASTPLVASMDVQQDIVTPSSSAHDSAANVEGAKHDQAEPCATSLQGEGQDEHAEDMSGAAELITMGFAKEQVQRALRDAHGDVELAVEYLLRGACGTFGSLEQQVRAALGNEQVQQALSDAQGKVERVTERAYGTFVGLEQKVQAVLHEEQAQQVLQGTREEVEKVVEHLWDGTCDAFGKLEQNVQVVLGNEQLQQALQDASRKAQLAAACLLDGVKEAFGKLEPNMQAALNGIEGTVQTLQSQLQEAATHAQEHLHNGDLGSLQATLEKMAAGIFELQDLVQSALKKVRGAQLDSQEEAKLQVAETQIADAQHFVAETLAVLRAHGSQALKGIKEELSTALDVAEPDNGSCDEAAVETVSPTEVETTDAQAENVLGAADATMATTEEALTPEAVSVPTSGADLIASGYSVHAASTSEQNAQQETANATSLDVAQVFVSRSLSMLRSHASRLLPAQAPTIVEG